MRSERMLWGMLISLALPATPTLAQTQMNCGSSGADGALVVPAGQLVTLNVPDTGIFNFTTVTVSGRLHFNRNTRFNRPVFLLASGDVVVASGAEVRVDGSAGSSIVGGSAGPGGFDGGAPGIAGGAPGGGHGPGAGGAGLGALPGGNAAYGGEPGFTNNATDGVTYGSPLLVPLAGGSGGGGDTNDGGTGGGGAILLCSPTQVVLNGTVSANGGGGGSTGQGSGGAIRLVSPSVRGSGTVSATGGQGYGGHGRIRVDVIDRSGLAMTFTPASALSVGSLMAVFPGTVPELHIVHVAGNDIPPGTPSPLVFTLPFNSPARHSITVRAEGFAGTVPVTVVVTPESGDRIVVNTDIDTSVSAEATVQVDLPQNVTARVHAWTR